MMRKYITALALCLIMTTGTVLATTETISENEVTRAPLTFDGYGYTYKKYSELINPEEITEAAITFDGENYIEEDLDELRERLAKFGDTDMELYTSTEKPETAFQPMILINVGDTQYKISPYGGITYGTYGDSFVYYDTIGHANALYRYGEECIKKYRDAATSADFTTSGKMLNCLELPQSDWVASEVKVAADENILPYELSCDYGENINRREFCELCAQALGIKESKLESPNTAADSRLCIQALDNIRKRYGIEKTDSETVFADYPNAPSYMDFLCDAGIISGRDDRTFAPEDDITREETAKIMVSIYSAFNQTDYTVDADYSDISDVSDWALPYVALCKKYSVMNGTGDGRFAPKDFCTREQAIACVYRLMNKIYQ